MDSNRFIRPIPSAHWIDFCTHPRCFLRIHRVFVDWNRCFVPPKTTRAPHFNTGVSDGLGRMEKPKTAVSTGGIGALPCCPRQAREWIPPMASWNRILWLRHHGNRFYPRNHRLAPPHPMRSLFVRPARGGREIAGFPFARDLTNRYAGRLSTEPRWTTRIPSICLGRSFRCRQT